MFLALAILVGVVAGAPEARHGGEIVCSADDIDQQEDDAAHSTLLVQAAFKVGKLAHTLPAALTLTSIVKRTAPHDNLCIGGRLAPELYVIGAQKAGTTSLAEELAASPFISTFTKLEFTNFYWPHYVSGFTFRTRKEPHFFDWYFDDGRDAWLRSMDTCRSDVRMVAADMTPMFQVKEVPARIAQWYGAQSNSLKFVVLLREPMSRMQSAFYHTKEYVEQSDLANVTFEQYVTRIVDDSSICANLSLASLNGEIPENVHEPFCDSLYAEHFPHWFEYFDASRFTIVPFTFQISRDNITVSVADSILDDIGISRSHQPVAHDNARSHPKLDDDLNPELFAKVHDIIEARSGPLVLARIFVPLPVQLYNYTGSSVDEEGIALWLSKTWG